jgi:hypothetical protein
MPNSSSKPAAGASEVAAGDLSQGEKPVSRGKTPYVPAAASTVSFAVSKKLQQAFDAVDVGKTKLIDTSQLTDFLEKAAIKYLPQEIERTAKQLRFDYDQGLREHAAKISFDDCLTLLSKPNYTFCLYVEEMVSKERRDMIRKYINTIVGSDDDARKALIAEPPTQLLGDKQAVRMVALEMQNQDHQAMTRVYLVRALGAIAERPREVSGSQPPEGEKRNMMLDAKAIAACCLSLSLGDNIYVDQRSFYNPEPRDVDDSAPPPVGVGLTQVPFAYNLHHEPYTLHPTPYTLHL